MYTSLHSTITIHFHIDIVYVVKSSLSKYVHGDHMYDMTVEVVSIICNLSLVVSMPYSSQLKSSRRNVLKWSISLRPTQPYNNYSNLMILLLMLRAVLLCVCGWLLRCEVC